MTAEASRLPSAALGKARALCSLPEGHSVETEETCDQPAACFGGLFCAYCREGRECTQLLTSTADLQTHVPSCPGQPRIWASFLAWLLVHGGTLTSPTKPVSLRHVHSPTVAAGTSPFAHVRACTRVADALCICTEPFLALTSSRSPGVANPQRATGYVGSLWHAADWGKANSCR